MHDSTDHSLLPIGSAPTDDAELSPAMRKFAHQLYRQARRAYDKAGRPYGDSDEAMMVWYTLHGQEPDSSFVTGRN